MGAGKRSLIGLMMSDGGVCASGASASDPQRDPDAGGGMNYGKYDARPI